MLSLLTGLFKSWILPASSQIWLLVAGAFGVLALVVKTMAGTIGRQKMKNKTLEAEVKKAERIQNVEVNTNRDDALDRLSKHGSVRKD